MLLGEIDHSEARQLAELFNNTVDNLPQNTAGAGQAGQVSADPGVVKTLQTQGPPGRAHPWGHKNLQSPSLSPLSIARVADTLVPAVHTPAHQGIQPISFTGIFSPPSFLPLSSSGLFSPPSTLPPVVCLPDHPPLSPITGADTVLSSDTNSFCSALTAEWDNYDDSPSFKLNQKFWGSRKCSETNPNFLDPLSPWSADIFFPLLESESSEDINTTMSIESKEVRDGNRQGQVDLEMRGQLSQVDNTIRKLNRLMSSFTGKDVNATNLHTVEDRLKEINDVHLDIWESVDNIAVEYATELGEEKAQEFKVNIANQNEAVNHHSTELRTKAQQLNPPLAPLSAYEKESLRIQKAAADAQVKMLNLEMEKRTSAVKENEAKVTTKASEFRQKVKLIGGKIKLVETRDDFNYWVKADDDTITDAMKEMEKWDSALASAEETYRNFEHFVKIHGEPTDADETGYDSQTIKDLLLELRVDFRDAKTAVLKEEKGRGLYSLDQSKGEVLKYPSFSGDPGQDLVKFREKMLYRFKRNQVCKKDQLEKLRETLKGQALRLVPDSMKSIEDAWAALQDAYGDPSRVLQHRLDNLRKMGDLPPDSVRGVPNFEMRVEYLLKFEGIVIDIIELGKSDDDLYLLSFNANTVAEVVNKFPNSMVLKLNKLPGKGKDRMINILEKIKDFRADAQSLQKTRSLNSSTNLPSRKERDDRGGRDKRDDPHNGFSAQVNYSPPRKESDCRACCHLKDVRKTEPAQDTIFYENHLSNYVTGCPQFIAMDMTARKELADDIKLCHKCFHPNVWYTFDHDKECSVIVNRKHGFSCSKCNMHSWICKFHKLENKDKLDKYKKEYREKHRMRLVFTANLPSQIQNPQPCPTTEVTSGVSAAVPEAVQECASNAFGLDHQQLPGQQPKTPAAYSACLSTIKKRLRKNGFKGEIIPPPEGEPMFLFHGAQGRTAPVNIFYDNGCSHAVFKEGIPGKELKGRILQKGPFHMKGVGGIVTHANDQWLAALDTVEGTKQLVYGLTVDKVTDEFPLTNLGAAVKDVQDDKPGDRFLQSCRIPQIAGGDVHLLLGILYIKIHPVMVHQLPCGVAIYKSSLASHNNKYNCLIGGPHKSFELLAGQVGNTAAMLTHFIEGLQHYRVWGPPKLPCAPLTYEEEMFAMKMNCVEGDMAELITVKELEEMEMMASEMLDCDEEQLQVHEQVVGEGDVVRCDCTNLPLCCSNVSNLNNLEMDRTPAKQEQIRFLKQLLLTQDSGLSVEYRCARCRDCWSCKNADETEKVSLRGEQENQLIRESVNLNFEKKIIECTLPVRGSEAEFLTSNKDLATKVLTSVCKRYGNDEIVKPMILAGFKKLFDKGYAKFLHELTDKEKAAFIEKEIQYFIPWRVQFADSVTTPCRPVLDGSSRTRKRPDGSGGRCLNDLVVKGSVNNLNLLRMILRWLVGLFAMSGDLAQFYNACKLMAKQWNLQRFVWHEDLNPNNPVLEGVITTLIYGVKSVSKQSEDAVEQLAETVKDDDPELAFFLRCCRYVDDMGESKSEKSLCKDLAARADQLFSMVGLECKGWTFSGEDPPEKISKNGLTIKIGGMIWDPKIDAVEVPIPLLHFSRPVRGRLDDKTIFFEGDFGDMERYVPARLTRRQIASKVASIFDLTGKLTPILIGLKTDLREVVMATESWDEAVPPELRCKWVRNFWKLEQLRGIRFRRPIMPETAINTDMRLITVVDAALQALVMGCWGCFELADGGWSSQLVLGRGLLAPTNSTIPKNELESLCGGSNLAWVVKKALGDWVKSSILVGDSIIALCWTNSENKRLSMFHKNRVIQIRRGTNLNELYHVKTSENPSDVGTRPGKVTLDDVGPDSLWENGTVWMHGHVQQAVDDGILVPAHQLRLNRESEEEFSKGLIFDSQIPEVITRGHIVNPGRVSLLQQRAEFSSYLIIPTKFNFEKMVRIYGYVMAFISKCRKKRFIGPLLCDGEMMFTVFTCTELGLRRNWTSVEISMPGDQLPSRSLVSAFAATLNPDFLNMFRAIHTENIDTRIMDRYINMALYYLFRKGANEVKKFNSAQTIKKHMVERDGILLSKNRMMDCLNYTYTGEISVDLGSLGIKANTPVLDRHSPLSYSIAQHIHWKLAPHRGMETHHRVALEHVTILQGMSLFKELSIECIRCNMRRKRVIEASMGGLSKYQLTIAPPFWVAQMDLFGPFLTYVPGFERNSSNRQVLEAKVWVMCVVCPTTRLVNLQVLEKSDAGGIICGVTRLSCEVGMPKFFLCDQDQAIMSGLENAEFDYRDLQLQLHRQKGIVFDYCSVGGHESHGMVERVIRSVQQGLNDCGLQTSRLHATGVQSLCKLVENAYNSVPIGYSYDRDQDNTGILKIICPNMMRMGRTNQRTLDGPIRLARGARELLTKVEDMYKAWFKVWQDTVVPKLLFQPKWYDKDCDLLEGDLVYFQKEGESQLDNKWTVGKVDQLIRGRDQKIRRVIVKYQNASENQSRLTDRNVRKLVKLFTIDEYQIQEDLTELQARIDQLQAGILDELPVGQLEIPTQSEGDDDELPVVPADQQHNGEPVVFQQGEQHAEEGEEPSCAGDDQADQGDDVLGVQPGGTGGECPAARTRSKVRCNCCCTNHCRFNFHTMGPEVRAYHTNKVFPVACELMEMKEEVDIATLDVEEDDLDTGEIDEVDSFAKVLKSLNIMM